MKQIARFIVATLIGVAISISASAADNVTVSNGPSSNNADYVTATDDIGGAVQAQKVKLLDPTDGSAAGIGIASNPLWCSVSGEYHIPINPSEAIA